MDRLLWKMPFVSQVFLTINDITTSNMRIKRRSFVHLLLALGQSYALRSLWSDAFAMPAQEYDPFHVHVLGPCLDTLIPEDETPSATQLEVDCDLLASASASVCCS